MEARRMKTIELIRALIILSLLTAPALSEYTPKGCPCTPGTCQCSHIMNACCEGHDSFFSQECCCNSQITAFSSNDLCETGYSYASKGSSRPISKRSTSTGISPSCDASICFESASGFNDVGPPDMDGVDYLPPSAKQVFRVLASDGLLTQKELISKTDLPPRTVRYALVKLKGEGILEERFCFRDARQSLYGLNGMAASK
jgi:DNA-binding transcriptional ArsR family regulator